MSPLHLFAKNECQLRSPLLVHANVNGCFAFVENYQKSNYT